MFGAISGVSNFYQGYEPETISDDDKSKQRHFLFPFGNGGKGCIISTLGELPNVDDMPENERNYHEVYRQTLKAIRKEDITPEVMPMPNIKVHRETLSIDFDGDVKPLAGLFMKDNPNK